LNVSKVFLISFKGGDPSNGFVQYVDKVTAAGSTLGGPLISTTDTTAYMGVDYWNLAPNGRSSVRVSTQTAYNYGVFILDLEHMPDNVCGTWPAFWTSSDAPYFEEGEIDIIESINENSWSFETLHTGLDYNGCQVAGNLFGNQQLGVESSYNCFENATTDIYGGTQSVTQGCSAYNYVENTYGSDFNGNGGGIYALWWTEELIAIYSWPRGSTDIPGDIASGSPYPQTWGEPVFTTAGGNCDVQTYFKNQKLIFDTDFCGGWADQFWSSTSCYDKDAYPTCESYVAANPASYEGAYWTVNSLQVYEWLDVESSSPT
jgi:hypothetical protein